MSYIYVGPYRFKSPGTKKPKITNLRPAPLTSQEIASNANVQKSYAERLAESQARRASAVAAHDRKDQVLMGLAKDQLAENSPDYQSAPVPGAPRNGQTAPDPQVAAEAAKLRPKLGSDESGLRKYARQMAIQAGIDPDIFEAQIQQESGFNPKSTSSAGAQGIAQIMPGTAAGWKVNPNDPKAALKSAAQHMAEYYHQYGGKSGPKESVNLNAMSDALAAYNGGPGVVGHGLPGETSAYIKNIMSMARHGLAQPGTAPAIDDASSLTQPVSSSGTVGTSASGITIGTDNSSSVDNEPNIFDWLYTMNLSNGMNDNEEEQQNNLMLAAAMDRLRRR